MTQRENFLRMLEWREPDWVPLRIDLLPGVVARHEQGLRDLAERHPLAFEGRTIGPASPAHWGAVYTAGASFTDDWGCRWSNAHGGILGQVVGHPLSDWSELPRLRVPDPDTQEDWVELGRGMARAKSAGELASGGLSVVNGGFFDRLQFLRGLENLLVDLVEEPPELQELIEVILAYNVRCVECWLETGVDLLGFHGDIATQRGLMMSPETFRRVLKPGYRRLFRMCRDAGVHVWYSCDGDLRAIIGDLVECGASVHDPQVGAGGIDGIAAAYRGRLAAMVDIDEQTLPTCTPGDIDRQIEAIVRTVGDGRGGVGLYACPSEDVPFSNIEAIIRAWERWRGYRPERT